MAARYACSAAAGSRLRSSNLPRRAWNCGASRIQLYRTPQGGHRVIDTVEPTQYVAEGRVQRGGVWLELDRRALLQLGSGVIAGPHQQRRQMGARLNLARIERHCLACRRHGLVDATLPDQQAAKCRIATSVSRIERDAAP